MNGRKSTILGFDDLDKLKSQWHPLDTLSHASMGVAAQPPGEKNKR